MAAVATGAETNRIGSLLVADCGTVTTRAVLLEQVGGEYRFVAHGEAPTTLGSCWNAVTDGVRHAIERISDKTGWKFIDENGDLISPQTRGQRGVDALACTASASEPLRVALGGLSEDLSIAGLRRVAAGTYSEIVTVLNDDDGIPLNEEGCVRAIRSSAPDVVCVAGGIEGGAERPVLDMVRGATLACSMMDREKRPTLLYAGNSRLRRRVADIVGDEAELRVADNVRPTLEDEYVVEAQQELQSLFVQRRLEELPGIATLSGWSPMPVAPTAEAFGRLIRYLWHLGDPERGVLGIDVGGSSTTLAAVFDDRLYLTIRSNLGSAFGRQHLLGRQDPEAVTRWLPEGLSCNHAHGLLIEKEAYPSSIPQIERDLWLEQAVAREAISRTLDLARPGWQPGVAEVYPGLMPLCDTIVVAGGVLGKAPRPGQAALILLDALQPIGISTLVLDADGLAPALGNVAKIKPVAAVEVLDAGGLTNLGTVVSPVGESRPGDTVLTMRVSYDSGRELDIEVRHGDLEIVPLPVGQEAVLDLSPRGGFDVGAGGRGEGGRWRVSGGLVGLIVDARGRPLRLATETEQRREEMRQWLSTVGA